jgi:hypothetical protein
MSINKNLFGFLFLFVLAQLLVVYAFAQGYIIIFLSVLLGLMLLFFTAFSVQRSFFLLVFYYLTFPEKHYLENFPGIPVFFVWYVGYPLFLFLVWYWILYLIQNQIRRENDWGETKVPLHSIPEVKVTPRTMDFLLLVFITSFFLSGILGYLKGYNRTYWAYDFMTLSLYFGYFIYFYSPLRLKPKFFFDFILFCAILVSAEHIYALTQLGGTVFLKRIISEYIHIAQMAIPYLGITIIYSSSKLRRAIFALLLPIILVAVLISQQRALWASVGLTLVLIFLIFVYEKRYLLFKDLRKTILRTVTVLILFVGLFLLFQNLTKGKLLPTILSRIIIFVSPKLLSSDISALARMDAIRVVLNTIKGNFLFGQGLGDSYVSRASFVEVPTVDNSFVFLYWKTGIFGLFSFLSLIFYFLYRCISVLNKKLLAEEKIYVLTALLNILGLLLIAFTNVCIVYFRFIIVWSASFAVVELIARKYERKISTNSTNASK